jgi:pseudouridine-5'-phosphate glycosidase/sugar/nucleoside kinase (ribokinase family)
MKTNWHGWPLQVSHTLAALIDWEHRCWRAPVVALESTLITHGLSYPENLEITDQVQSIIRSHGAYPAVLVIIKGVIWVDPDPATLRHVAVQGARTFHKCNKRDLSVAIAEGWNGSLTVSAVMEIAHGLGIRVFVTGGIGGVHRDFAQSHDVSSDLAALARIPVCVVCAGIKSVLDIGATLEHLESEAVPVIVVGSDEFPAFWSRRSGFAAPARLDGAVQVATMLRLHLQPLLIRAAQPKQSAGDALDRAPSGVLVALPVPVSEQCRNVEPAIQQALAEAAQQSIHGKALTPFLLDRVAALTQGASVRANMALLRHNASFGAQLASAFYQLSHGISLGAAIASTHPSSSSQHTWMRSSAEYRIPNDQGGASDRPKASVAEDTEEARSSTAADESTPQPDTGIASGSPECPRPLGWLPLNVIGHWSVDIHAFCNEAGPGLLGIGPLRASHPGRVTFSYGGVGYNMALTLGHLSGGWASPHFFTHGKGNTHVSKLFQRVTAGLDAEGACLSSATFQPSAMYVAIHDRDREMLVAVFDGHDLEPDVFANLDPTLPVVWDANLTSAAMAMLPSSACFWFEPTSPAKAGRVVAARRLSALPWMSPNETELVAIARTAGYKSVGDEAASDAPDDAQVDATAKYLIREQQVQNILVTRGARGVTWFQASKTTPCGVVRKHFDARPVPKDLMRSTTGAGDVFAAAVIFALLCHRLETPEEAIHFGLEAAALACQYETAVPPARALQRLLHRRTLHRL